MGTHAESWNYWKVRDALWRLAQEDREEDGGVAARDLHLPILRKRRAQASGRRHLALQRLSQDDRWWRLGSFYHCRRYRPQCHQTSQGNPRASIRDNNNINRVALFGTHYHLSRLFHCSCVFICISLVSRSISKKYFFCQKKGIIQRFVVIFSKRP